MATPGDQTNGQAGGEESHASSTPSLDDIIKQLKRAKLIRTLANFAALTVIVVFTYNVKDDGFIGTLFILYILMAIFLQRWVEEKSDIQESLEFEGEEEQIREDVNDVDAARRGFSTRFLRLHRRRRRLEKKLRFPFRLMWVLIFVASIGLLMMGVQLLFPDTAKSEWTLDLQEARLMFITGLIYCIPFAVSYMTGRKTLEICSEDIREAELDKQLYAGDLEPYQVRARRLFRINQEELRRYYDLNIRQNQTLFRLGIVVIFAGLAVACVSIFLVSQTPENVDEPVYQIWQDGFIAVIGIAGTILANFVGSVFLKMHARANDSLDGFHKRLVETHTMFFSNVIASDITIESIRVDVQQALAKKIAGASGE